MFGIRASDIASVKKDGRRIKGIIYPLIIPYSFTIYLFVYPHFVKAYVRIIGSKKKPIEPMIRLAVVGMPIEKTSLIFTLSGFKSFFEILKFLGMKKNRTNIDVSSLIILTSTTKATAYSNPFCKKNGIPIIRAISLMKSSVTFDRTCGNIFCFPKKYPLKILDILINGRTKPMLIKA